MFIVKFDAGMKKLESLYLPKGQTELAVAERNIYYDHLKHLDDKLFDKAIDYVIDTKKIKSFPTPGEILEASVLASQEVTDSSMPESTAKCGNCDGIGYKLKICEGHFTATPCDCELGKKINEGWTKHFKRRKK